VASVLGNLVIQRGFQMAPLRHVLPAMAAAEPVTAFLCARYVFGEHLNNGAVGVLGVGGGLVLMVCGVVLCAVGRTRPARAPSPPALPASETAPEGAEPGAVRQRHGRLHVPGLEPMPALPCLPPFGSSSRRLDHLPPRVALPEPSRKVAADPR
jgi:hypothetical protein